MCSEAISNYHKWLDGWSSLENKRGLWVRIPSLLRPLRGAKKAYQKTFGLADSFPNNVAFVLSRDLICSRYCRASNWGTSQLHKNLSILKELKFLWSPWYPGGGDGDYRPRWKQGLCIPRFSFWKTLATNTQQGPSLQEVELKAGMSPLHSIRTNVLFNQNLQIEFIILSH